MDGAGDSSNMSFIDIPNKLQKGTFGLKLEIYLMNHFAQSKMLVVVASLMVISIV